MALRRDTLTSNLRTAVAGEPIEALAAAADTNPETLTARLEGRDELTVADLIGVGGYLRSHPATFLEGATP